MHTLLAALPIALVLAAMIGLRWSAAVAGLIGLSAALVLAIAVFGLGGAAGPASGAAGALAEALFVAGTILWIVFPALCIYDLQAKSGAFDVLRLRLVALADDPRLVAILVAWFFALFMEGAAGFGTPIALAAPILVSMGFQPVQAMTLALIGHAAGVSFGAVGTPVLAQIAATGLPGTELVPLTALLHALAGWILVAFLLRLAGPAWPGLRHWGWGALAAALFLLPSLALAAWVGPELPTLGGAIFGGAVFALLLGRRAVSDRVPPPGAQVLQAALPYLVLLVLVLATRLLPPLREALRAVVWDWTLFDTFSGSVEPLYHPGTLLMLAFIAGGVLQRRSARQMLAAAAAAARRLLPVLVALVAMLGLSRLMVHSDMIGLLADAAASTGAAWPLFAPFVGVLGTFVTGAATSSNILFAGFQQSTATALGLPAALMQAGQGFGAAVGNIVCPHNIIAAGATVGLAGREGEVLRATALACLAYATAGGLLLMLLVQLWPQQ